MNAENGTLHEPLLPQDTHATIMRILNEHPGELEPQTLKDLFIYILQANSDTHSIHKSIKLYEETKGFTIFFSAVRKPLLHSIKAITKDAKRLSTIDALINDKIPDLEALHDKIWNLFIKDSYLKNSVNEFLRERNMKNEVLIFLTFLVQSLIGSRVTPEENRDLKFYMKYTAQREGDIHLQEGQKHIFKVFTFFKAKKPKNAEGYFEVEIPKKGMKIPGRFFSFRDPSYKDKLLLLPYTEFTIQKIENENGVEVTQLRFVPEDDLKKEDLQKDDQIIPVEPRQRVEIFDDHHQVNFHFYSKINPFLDH